LQGKGHAEFQPVSRQVGCFATIAIKPSEIPVEFELPGSVALLSREGDRLIIEPIRRMGLAALLDSWQPLAKEFLEIDDPHLAPEDVF